jgi:hypothetical protein
MSASNREEHEMSGELAGVIMALGSVVAWAAMAPVIELARVLDGEL